MKVCLYIYFWWCRYFWRPWMSFAMTDRFSARVTKITPSIGASWTHSLPFWFWPIFNSLKIGVDFIFIMKGFCYSYACSCSLCEGRTSVCTGLISRKLCIFLLMFLAGFTSFIVILVFPLLVTFFVFIHSFWYISSNNNEAPSINPSANMFVFEGLTSVVGTC